MTENPHGELTIRIDAMPADTNAYGDVFGGWVLSQMDSAGGIAAVHCCGGRAVTVPVDAMTFIRPVKVGDVLCVYTEVIKVGRTSMRIRIEAWARRFLSDVREKVTEAEFVYVAIDVNGKPKAFEARSAAPALKAE
jgi:acyl-CoA thioesterase YciA